MLSVLHCLYDDVKNPWVGGGGAVRVHEIYRRLSDRVRATVVTGKYQGARDETIDGVRYERLGLPRPYALSRLSYAVEANARLRRARVDAAVFDFSTFTPLFVPDGVAITVHHRSGARFYGVARRAIERLEHAMLARASRFSATSDDMARKLAGLAPVDIVKAGVSDSLFTLVRTEQPYVLFIGRMDVAHKGLDVLLDAFARLDTRLTLEIAGRGRERERVASMARARGVAERVRVRGAVSDAERDALYGSALAVVVPSRFEGFGLVAAEAMAAGAPVIASDIAALREVVGGSGLLVPCADANALAAALGHVTQDAELRLAMSRRGREAAKRYRWEAVADAHYRFLQNVAAR